MPIFLLEPVNGRIAVSVPPKAACTTLRMWLWELGTGHPFTGGNIHPAFEEFTVKIGNPLPDTVQLVVAVHRDGVSRMRSAYDHRIRCKKEAPERGLDHFAKNLPEYCKLYPSIQYHCRAQSVNLGCDLSIYTDIIPLNQLERLLTLTRKALRVEPPPLLRVHETVEPSVVSEEATEWFERWTAYDTAIGWDGKTRKSSL